MQNFFTLPQSVKRPISQFPPCKCEKCTKLRSKGESEQNDVQNHCIRGINDEILKENDALQNCNTLINIGNKNGASKFKIGNYFAIPKFSMPSWNLRISDVHSVLFDIVGIISFFTMATFMFWITICQYLWRFATILFQSGRRAQLIAMVLLLSLCVSITCHAIKDKHYRQDKIHATAMPTNPVPAPNNTIDKQDEACPRKQTSRWFFSKNYNTLNTSKKHCKNCNESFKAQKHPSLCDLCAKQMKPETIISSSKLSDDEIMDMYKRYKLYSVPLDMKTPPSIGSVFNVLSGLYHGMASSAANAPLQI